MPMQTHSERASVTRERIQAIVRQPHVHRLTVHEHPDLSLGHRR
jgi:hypothetical protein